MKRILSVFLALAVSATLVIVATTPKHGVPVVHAQSCSNATLTGNYGFVFSGFGTETKSVNSKLVPFYGAGLATFDGIGSVSATFTFSLNGDGGVPNNPYSASYTVNSDCTVSITGTPGTGSDSLAAVIVSGGAEILATDISAPDTLNVDFKKQ